MKHYFMTCGLATVLAAASLSAIGEDKLTIDGAAYQPVEVNGQRYYLKDSGQRSRTKRSADLSSAGPALYIGDVLRRSAVEPELKVSGSILVKATEPEAREIAQRHGLVLQQHIGTVALFQASGSIDMSQLAERLRQEGREVQIEVSGPLHQPN